MMMAYRSNSLAEETPNLSVSVHQKKGKVTALLYDGVSKMHEECVPILHLLCVK